MDANASGAGATGTTPMYITGGDGGQQPLVLSAEEAAQLLAQAGIQLGDNEQVIIGDMAAGGTGGQESAHLDNLVGGEESLTHGTQVLSQEAYDQSVGQQILNPDGTVGQMGDGGDDGTVLYIDPNDPQAAEILQQAGLRLTEDGQVVPHNSEIDGKLDLVGMSTASSNAQDLIGSLQSPVTTAVASQPAPIMLPQQPVPATKLATPVAPRVPDPPARLPGMFPTTKPEKPAPAAPAAAPPINDKQVMPVGPDQQQVMYTVTGEDGNSQQYMMLCPKDMDQNLLIQTLVKQISSDPATKGGKKTIRITQQRGAMNKLGGMTSSMQQQQQQQQQQPALNTTPLASTVMSDSSQSPTLTSMRKSMSPGKTARALPAPAKPKPGGRIRPGYPQSTSQVDNRLYHNTLDANDVIESVMPDIPLELTDGSTRVYVRCNYCPEFRSSLNGDTWETILNHILPVSREEIQTSFYGDLSKHFIRSLRIQINGKQTIKTPTKDIPQCEVVLTHSLVCRKTKREFIVANPDAAFVANLAKHIRQMQPGHTGRGNSLLCIFCNSPFTYEDYIRHIQPHLEAIVATLECFAGAYCSNMYDGSIRATHPCTVCAEEEASDLRFLPCTKFSNDYSCLKKLQFGVDCFREHYGDNGFLRLNTSSVSRCSVCKNTGQVYCAVFHISTTVLSEDGLNQAQEVDSQLAVCVNCQKQFINIVMKEQGFDERFKVFQLKNMEQLCSVLRVILNQATAICDQKKTLIYTVHENSSNPNSAVHVVKSAEVTQTFPLTKMMSLAESDIVGSSTKVFYICDLCLFTVDLTSLVASPKDRQKNDMLLAIVLEHLVPHTESLMNVIASTAANQTFNLKYEVMAKVTDIGPSKKIVLSLQKKFKCQNSTLEIPIEKDEEKTLAQVRNGIKSEKKNYISLRQVKGPDGNPSSSVALSPSNLDLDQNAGQLVELNKYMDKQRGKVITLAQTGCNTTLLNAYVECNLCSKFSFPDFRLAGANAQPLNRKGGNINLCENCVDTVLTLCLPTEPECLQLAEDCLALGEPKVVGHRLVLSNNLKKWLSLDGVNLIKKTVDDFDDTKSMDCSNLFLEALKKHSTAVLKTCQKDEDITSAVAGFCVTDAFLALDKNDDATNAAMASLEQQIGMSITPAKPTNRIHEVHVTILSRRRKFPNGNARLVQRRNMNGRNEPPKPIKLTTPATSQPEESVSAIQSFIDQTSGIKKESPSPDMKLPPGIKITSAGKGLVNIRAVADAAARNKAPATESSPSKASQSPTAATTTTTSSPSTSTTTAGTSLPTPSTGSSSVRGMSGVSTVTLTPNGVLKKELPDAQARLDLSDDHDEGDSDEEISKVTPVAKTPKRKWSEQSQTPVSKSRVTPITPKITAGSSNTPLTGTPAAANPSGDESRGWLSVGKYESNNKWTLRDDFSWPDVLLDLAWNPKDPELILIGSGDGYVLWDPEVMHQSSLSTFLGHSELVHESSWSQDHNSTFASCSSDGSALIWDSRHPPQNKLVHGCDVLCLAWSSSHSDQLVTGSIDGGLRLWDLRNPAQPVEVFHEHTYGIRRVQTRPDGLIISASYDFTTR
ncbi:hypothetical protein TCAL_00036 [Tigriopus californicus]|uniref:Peroxin-7 n=1 Tax=Tigriopus californicus TaxID=6832 RepID=A0A553PFF4_TIGCA|nr:hypothetical protein TCAL_00036 [Tigriopus californicus]